MSAERNPFPGEDDAAPQLADSFMSPELRSVVPQPETFRHRLLRILTGGTHTSQLTEISEAIHEDTPVRSAAATPEQLPAYREAGIRLANLLSDPHASIHDPRVLAAYELHQQTLREKQPTPRAS